MWALPIANDNPSLIRPGLFFFDSSYRPVPLELQFVGVSEPSFHGRAKLMGQLTYDKVTDALKQVRADDGLPGNRVGADGSGCPETTRLLLFRAIKPWCLSTAARTRGRRPACLQRWRRERMQGSLTPGRTPRSDASGIELGEGRRRRRSRVGAESRGGGDENKWTINATGWVRGRASPRERQKGACQ